MKNGQYGLIGIVLDADKYELFTVRKMTEQGYSYLPFFLLTDGTLQEFCEQEAIDINKRKQYYVSTESIYEGEIDLATLELSDDCDEIASVAHNIRLDLAKTPTKEAREKLILKNWT